jgi:hypothetical protein
MLDPVVIMRRLEKSALVQRGFAIIMSSCAGTSTVSVMRSFDGVESRLGSKLGCSTTVQPACSAGVVWLLSPPTWNSGSVVRMHVVAAQTVHVLAVGGIALRSHPG